MIVERALVERLEHVETVTVEQLVDALVATRATDPVPTAEPVGRGWLVLTGPARYVNRLVGATLGTVTPADVATVVRRSAEAGVPAGVQLSSWAAQATVEVLATAGFTPESCRSVLAVDPRGVPLPAGTGVEVLEVGADATLAACASDVMVAETLAEGGDRTASDEFMAADRVGEGTTQLLALLDGHPVGCGSLTVVEADAGRTGWLGAAATTPMVRRRGVQTALVHARLRLAAQSGCDLVGVTASTGSPSTRVLQRCGFSLVEEQWIVRQG